MPSTSTDAPQPPYSIIVHMIDGTPFGLRTVQSPQGVARGLIIPRGRFVAARELPELKRTGVYLLVGRSIETGEERIYIGQGDTVLPRLDVHAAQKDFWTTAFVFTGRDDTLNTAHLRYLEAKLIGLAGRAKQAELDNLNRTEPPKLGEVDRASAEWFLRDMLICFGLVGTRAFVETEAPIAASSLLTCTGPDAEARGRPDGDGLVVLSGSRARAEAVPATPNYIRLKREQLLRDGVVRRVEGSLVFTQDYRFDSSTAAASTVLGRSAGGPASWIDASGKSLKQREGL